MGIDVGDGVGASVGAHVVRTGGVGAGDGVGAAGDVELLKAPLDTKSNLLGEPLGSLTRSDDAALMRTCATCAGDKRLSAPRTRAAPPAT